MKKIALVILLAMPCPAWASEIFTDENGCYTTRKWERRCLATPNPVTNETIYDAKARAKEKVMDTYKAMELAKVKAKEKTSGRDPSAFRRTKVNPRG